MACFGEWFNLIALKKKKKVLALACWLLENWGSLLISVAFKHTDLRQEKGEPEGRSIKF